MPIALPKPLCRLTRNIPLRWIFTVSFVLSTVGVAGLVGYLAAYSGQSAGDELWNNLRSSGSVYLLTFGITIALGLFAAKQLQQSFQRIQAALDESKEKFTTIFRASPDPIAIASLEEGRLLEVNDSLLEFFGYSRTEILNRTALELNLWHNLEQRAQYRALLEQQGSVRNLEVQVRTKAGAVKTVLLSAEVRTLDGQDCLIVMHRDISDLKRIEAALRSSEANLLHAQQIAHLGSWKVDLTTQENAWSAELFRVLGLDPTRSQPSFATLLNLIPAEERDAVATAVRAMVTEGTPYDIEHRVQRLDGSVRYVISKGEAVFHDQQVVKLYGTVLDITDLRQAEAALQASEARFRQFAETVREGFFIFETTTLQYSYLNSAYISISGIPTPPSQEDQDVSRGMVHWLNNIHPDDRDRIKAALQRERQGENFHEEYRFLRPDGELRWLRSQAFPIQNQAGEVMRIVGTVEDITDRKQLEQSLRSQAEEDHLLASITQNIRQSLELEQILETTVIEVQQTLNADRALIFRLNSDGSGQVIQEAVVPEYPVTDQMRWEDEHFPSVCYEHYQQGIPRIVPDVATDAWACCLAEFLQEMGVKSKIVAPIVQTQGKSAPQVWGLLVVHACSHYRHWQKSEANLLQQIGNQLAIVIDQANLYQQLQSELTERKQTEAALRESEELFRGAFDDAPIGISLISRTGEFLRANTYYCTMLGYTEAELAALTFQEITHPADLQADLEGLQQILVGESPWFQMEKRYLTKQGAIIPTLMKTAPIRDQDGQILYFVGHIQDIRERLKIERMKDEFISVLSHELRTPLTSIRGALGILESSVFDDRPEKAKHMLHIALNNSDRLVRLVNDILDLERLQSGKAQLVMQSCQVADLLQQAVDGVQAIADQFSITLSLTAVSATLWAAPDAIVQTLTNLLSNAIKFSSPGDTVWLKAAVGVGDWGLGTGEEAEGRGQRAEATQNSKLKTQNSKPPCLLFSIADQGRGIPVDKLEIIFEQFQQVDVSDARQKGGTGLGLAICKNIVQQHGGRIWVESSIGQGSTFYFTLPLRRNAE